MIGALRGWWYRRKPRCAAEPPWRLDAGPCIMFRGHTGDLHADGTGLVWNDQRWAWHGPVLDLADVLADLEADARARNIDPDDWPKFIESTELTEAGQIVRQRMTQPDDERSPDDPVRQSNYTPCAVEHEPGRVCIRPEGHR